MSGSGSSGTSRRRWRRRRRRSTRAACGCRRSRPWARQGASVRGEERGIDLGDWVHIKIEAQVECPAGVEI
jgi:hypothetical protein